MICATCSKERATMPLHATEAATGTRIPFCSHYEARFWAKVAKSDGCWLWTGAFQGRYGVISAGPRIGTRHPLQGAHRAAYRIQIGPIPDGMHVCHHCDTPACVRGDHLFIGTRSDNMQDASRKGRVALHQAKFTRHEVEELRRRHVLGERIPALANSFGRPYQMVWAAIRGVTWK